VKSEQLDYASSKLPINKGNPPWRRLIFAIGGILFLAISIGCVVLFVALMNSGWPIPEISIPLMLAAGFFGLMAFLALWEVVREKR
jgi:hypothetical protein